jgi:hypothetical protein
MASQKSEELQLVSYSDSDGEGSVDDQKKKQVMCSILEQVLFHGLARYNIFHFFYQDRVQGNSKRGM